MPAQPDVTLHYGVEGSSARDFRVAKQDILIGRASECDICLDDPQVSRFHASLRVAPDGLWLLDMDSKNGTLIADEPIPPNRRIPLQAGQKFDIGSYTFMALVSRTDVLEQTIMQPGVARPHMYDVDALRNSEFPAMLKRANLNNATAAPAPLRTINKIKWMMEEMVGTTKWHDDALDFIAAFQGSMANLLNAASPHEIVVVEGCSIGLNLIAQSLNPKPGDTIVICDLEYPANVYPWMSLQRDGAIVKQVPARNGGLTLDALKDAVDSRTRVVAASAVQFFSGHRTDLAGIGKFCRERDIIFVVDAIQAIGHMPIDVQKMNIDVLVTGGHKSAMALPTSGFMYVRDAVSSRLSPRVVGALSTADWSYYLNYDLTPAAGAWRFQIGVPNFVGMAGMMESITLINELTREAIDRHTTRLAARTLELAGSRGYELTTTPGEHSGIATFKSKFDKEKTGAYVKKLEQEEGILLAIHLDRQDQPHVRISFHCYNTEEEIDRAFEALGKMQ